MSTFAEDAGIRLADEPAPLFQLLVLCMLQAKPIRADVATATARALFDAGLYCRADDRGDPVIQLAPPLTIGQPEFDDIEQRLRSVLQGAEKHL